MSGHSAERSPPGTKPRLFVQGERARACSCGTNQGVVKDGEQQKDGGSRGGRHVKVDEL